MKPDVPDTDASLPTQAIAKEPEVLAPEDRWAPASGAMRWAWIAVALVTGVYVFVPEPTDVIPVLGWLDEGLAVIIFTFALEKLGIKVPLLDRLLHKKRIGQ